MTTSGGIGGLPPAPAVDFDCCGCGGAGLLGFGSDVTFGNLRPDIRANNSFTLLETNGQNYSLSITNPLSVDAWVSGMIMFGELFIQTGTYVGPLNYRQQANVVGGNLPLGAALVMAGTIEAGLTGPLPPNGQVFLPAMLRPFGQSFLAGETKTIELLHAMFLTDDGSQNTYPIGFNGLPRIIHTGVPI